MAIDTVITTPTVVPSGRHHTHHHSASVGVRDPGLVDETRIGRSASGRMSQASTVQQQQDAAGRSYLRTAQSGGVTKPRAKKITVACNFCRSRKLKCDGGRPACGQCVKRTNPCDYMPPNKRRGAPRHRARGAVGAEGGDSDNSESVGEDVGLGPGEEQVPPKTLTAIPTYEHQAELYKHDSSKLSSGSHSPPSLLVAHHIQTQTQPPLLRRSSGRNQRDRDGFEDCSAVRVGRGPSPSSGGQRKHPVIQRQQEVQQQEPMGEQVGSGPEQRGSGQFRSHNNELPHLATLTGPGPGSELARTETPDTPMSGMNASLPLIRPATEQQATSRRRPTSGTGSGKAVNSHSVTVAGNNSVGRPGGGTGPKVVACNFCRARKTKCDGAHPSCASCTRRSLPCNYVHDAGATTPGAGGVGNCATSTTKKGGRRTKTRPESPTDSQSQSMTPSSLSPSSSKMVPTPSTYEAETGAGEGDLKRSGDGELMEREREHGAGARDGRRPPPAKKMKLDVDVDVGTASEVVG